MLFAKGNIPWTKGRVRPPEVKRKISEGNKGRVAWNKGMRGLGSGSENNFYGKKHSEETKRKMSESAKKKFARMSEKERKNYGRGWRGKFGPLHIRYKSDRTTLRRENRHNDLAYKGWRRDVYRRDRYECRIDNGDCSGRIEAHHILSWREFLEVRYNVSNGITLCRFHHPRVRKEEKLLIPAFQGLVGISSE